MRLMKIETRVLWPVLIALLLAGCSSGGKVRVEPAVRADLPVMTESDLKKYNGDDPDLPIYIGLGGVVYDVTAGKKFYQKGGRYHALAGKDSSKALRFFGGKIIKRKYPVIAVLKPAAD